MELEVLDLEQLAVGGRGGAHADHALLRPQPDLARRDLALGALLLHAQPAAVEMRPLPVDPGLERRHLGALAELVRAARAEVAPGRAVGERGRQPRDGRQPLGTRPVDAGDRPEQPPRVRVLGVVEEVVERALLHDPAGVHDRHPVGDVRHHAEVVGHKDHGGVGLLAQVPDALEDLRLDRHVERGGGLVRDQDVRVAGKRHGDHHALAHAAGELERVGVDPLAGSRYPDALEQLHDPLAGLRVGYPLVCLDLLDDLRPDLLHRVQRAHRVLEDHRDLRAAHALEALVVGRDQVLALVDGGAAEARVRGAREAHQRHRGHGLAGARLADDREDLALADVERHAVHGLHDALVGGERHLEVADAQQWLGHRYWSRIRGSRAA